MSFDICEYIQRKNGILEVKVVPNSSKNEICGMLGEHTIKIKLQALPEHGKANKALIQFLAQILGLTQKNISIISGKQTQKKLIKIQF